MGGILGKSNANSNGVSNAASVDVKQPSAPESKTATLMSILGKGGEAESTAVAEKSPPGATKKEVKDESRKSMDKTNGTKDEKDKGQDGEKQNSNPLLLLKPSGLF